MFFWIVTKHQHIVLQKTVEVNCVKIFVFFVTTKFLGEFLRTCQTGKEKHLGNQNDSEWDHVDERILY